MMLPIRLLLLLLMFMPSLAGAVVITDMPPVRTAKYGVYWEGVRVAGMAAEFSDSFMKVDISAYGLLRDITDFRSRTQTDYALGKNGARPFAFKTWFKRRKAEKTIHIMYDPDAGKTTQDVVLPPDNRLKRPAVSVEGKDSAVDPLTAALLARQYLRTALAAGKSEFSFRLYD